MQVPALTTLLGARARRAASYGGLARFKSVSRLHTVGDRVVLGAGGEYSDLQHLLDELSEQESAPAASAPRAARRAGP